MRRKSLCVVFSLFFTSSVFASELIDVASVQSHCLLLFDDGRILPYGDRNCCGQLGLPDMDEQLITDKHPHYIEAPVKFVSVAAGDEFSLAVGEDGSLWEWGNNKNNGFWLIMPQSVRKPQMMYDSKDWKKVFAGGSSALALKNDGTLWWLPRLEPEPNPYGNAWKDVRIFWEYHSLSEYVFLAVLQDEKDNFWILGPSEWEEDNDTKIVDSFLAYKCFVEYDDHEERAVLPLKLPQGTTYFQVTDTTGISVDRNDVLIFGLSVCGGKRLFQERKQFRKTLDFGNFSNIKLKEKSKKFKKVLTGNFSEVTAFLVDGWDLTEDGLEKDNGQEPHYYAYAALLQNDGRLIVYTNGERLESDRSLKIKNICGGRCLFAQDENDHVYFIGYRVGYTNDDLFLWDERPKENFFYFEPLCLE